MGTTWPGHWRHFTGDHRIRSVGGHRTHSQPQAARENCTAGHDRTGKNRGLHSQPAWLWRGSSRTANYPASPGQRCDQTNWHKVCARAVFKEGEILLELDNTDYRIELQTAQAALAQARSTLASEQGNQVVAKADFELLGLNVDERERALILRKPQLESAKATVQSAQAGVERARVNLERTILRAPFDGVVVSRQASVGAQVSPTTALGVLASSEAYWITVAVPQADLKWIKFPEENNQAPLCA